jgi:hypothetical protein
MRELQEVLASAGLSLLATPKPNGDGPAQAPEATKPRSKQHA